MDLAAVSSWFDKNRGIRAETLRAFNVGVNGGNLTFPYPNGVKERPDPTVPLPPERRRFYFTQGKVPDLFQSPGPHAGDTAFLVEGETDTMRLWQELRDEGNKSAVFGIGGINTWHAGVATVLSPYKRVFVILDNDQDYMVKGQVDGVWKRIRPDLDGRAKRVYLPNDVKDVCEFFARYDLDILRDLAQRMGQSRYTPIDFLQPPPPVRWLMEGWVAMGDLTVLAGKGGLGKSWLTMGLTVAALEASRDSFLDKPMIEHGPVLYVDEENPQDVVYDRLKKLGFDPAIHAGKLRYLWNQGVKLDRNADMLLEEALDFKPKLIVLDSLTRLHSKEENVAGEIAPLFNDCIKPLARDTGAAVVLIHHHDKNAAGPRGSTDIVNASDAVIEAYDQGQSNPGKFRLKLTKSRRRLGGTEIMVGIVDTDAGYVDLKTDAPLNPPF